MSDDLRSMLLAPAGLYLPLLLALVLSITRSPRRFSRDPNTQLVGLFLLGIACQCAHLIEEFSTAIYLRFPPLFGLNPISAEVFVGFNVFWLGVFVLTAFGLLHGFRIAYFPVWFFGLAMCLNGLAHPLLSIWTGGYFPGLFTSPFVAAMGFMVTRALFRSTERPRR